MSTIKRISAFIEVKEDWYGNFKIENDQRFLNSKFVQVSLIELTDKSHRVCIWGNDDLGMEWDFPADKRSDALAVYQQILITPYPSRKWLESIGFVYA